jgi:hypothetical protein
MAKIYLSYGMPPREILDQLISRSFIRDPGNNALEDVVQTLAEVAEQVRAWCRAGLGLCAAAHAYSS